MCMLCVRMCVYECSRECKWIYVCERVCVQMYVFVCMCVWILVCVMYVRVCVEVVGV